MKTKKKAAVTRWFDIANEGNPSIPGWYECAYWPGDTDTRMIQWDGKRWLLKAGGPAYFGTCPMGEQWRGIASDPSKGA